MPTLKLESGFEKLGYSKVRKEIGKHSLLSVYYVLVMELLEWKGFPF